MKIKTFMLSLLTIVALFATSCNDDNDTNTNTNTDSVVFAEAPTFSEAFSANNSVEVITEETVR